MDDGLDLLAQGVVGVADPGEGGGYVEGAVEGVAVFVGEDDAGFVGDEEGCAVVGVAAEAWGFVVDAVEEGAEVGVEAVVADEEFVELSAGGDVLVVEDEGLGDVGFAEEMGGNFFHELGGEDFGAGEEVGDGGEAVGQAGGF